MTLAGLPATTTPGGTSFVITLHAPTIELSPIVTPGRMVARMPTWQLSPISILPNRVSESYLSSNGQTSPWLTNVTSFEMQTRLPIRISQGSVPKLLV